MNCVGERSDGTLYACGANFEPDLFALGTSDDDGESWEPVWRFAKFESNRTANGPLECPAGTIQEDMCQVGDTAWSMLFCDTFMFDFDECPDPAAPDAGTVIEPPGDDDGGGCCRVSGGMPRGTAGAMVLIALYLLVWGRRRPPQRR